MPAFPYKLRIFGDLSYGTGYNNALRGLLQALKCLQLDPDSVRVVGAVTGSIYQEWLEKDWLQQYVYQEWAGDDKVNVALLNPGMVGDYWTPLGERYNIAYCSWETDSLPKSVFRVNGEDRTVAGDLNKYDEVWTPSEQVAATFRRCGVEKPIFVIPHPLQEELLARPVSQTGTKRGYYFIGSWNARKNPQQLLRTWFETGWRKFDPVDLTLHCVPASRELSVVEAHSYIAVEGAKNLVEALGGRKDLTPPFGLLTTPRAYIRMLDLHAANEVFVTASNGEGFNVGAAEAAAMGAVVVGTKEAVPCLWDLFGTLDDDLDLPSLWHSVASTLAPITPMPECRGYELDQKWWAPDTVDLLYAIKEVRDGYSYAARKAWAERVREALKPSTVAGLIEKRLEVAAEVLGRSGW